jgi:hypothetical protein
MNKQLIRPLEDWMAIPQIVTILNLSRARVHQLIDEDKFNIEDMRVVGDKRMVIIKNAAVYAQLRAQEKRAARIAADKAEEERRLLGRMIVNEADEAIRQQAVREAFDSHAPSPLALVENELPVSEED